jgi:hypothetical protein
LEISLNDRISGMSGFEAVLESAVGREGPRARHVPTMERKRRRERLVSFMLDSCGWSLDIIYRYRKLILKCYLCLACRVDRERMWTGFPFWNDGASENTSIHDQIM